MLQSYFSFYEQSEVITTHMYPDIGFSQMLYATTFQ